MTLREGDGHGAQREREGTERGLWSTGQREGRVRGNGRLHRAAEPERGILCKALRALHLQRLQRARALLACACSSCSALCCVSLRAAGFFSLCVGAGRAVCVSERASESRHRIPFLMFVNGVGLVGTCVLHTRAQVEAEAVNAPPPTMATFAQPAQQAGAPGGMPMVAGAPGGGTPMGMPGMPGMPGGMGGMGTPGGGNMFARQARTGARSRYVDTLNPNANDPTPVRTSLTAANDPACP